MIRRALIYLGFTVALALFVAGALRADTSMKLPPEVRQWYFNTDGSCVQCTLGMLGVWANMPQASTLLWDTPYGPAERGGSTPSRVGAYARARRIPAYNVTGETTVEWLEWAARTGRHAGVYFGFAHFQTEYGRGPGYWLVCDNQTPHEIHRYTHEQFVRKHRSSGLWCVILDTPAPPEPPIYTQWWR